MGRVIAGQKKKKGIFLKMNPGLIAVVESCMIKLGKKHQIEIYEESLAKMGAEILGIRKFKKIMDEATKAD